MCAMPVSFRNKDYIFKIFFLNQEFFVQRTFTIFDKDKSGTISAAEFLETMSDFSKQGNTEKITYLFKIYDIDGKANIFLNCIVFILLQFFIMNGFLS